MYITSNTHCHKCFKPYSWTSLAKRGMLVCQCKNDLNNTSNVDDLFQKGFEKYNKQPLTWRDLNSLPKPKPLTGWICPVCGGGVAPGVQKCPCLVQPTMPAWPSTPTYDPQPLQPKPYWVDLPIISCQAANEFPNFNLTTNNNNNVKV